MAARRKGFFSLEVWGLVTQPCYSGWPHTGEAIGRAPWNGELQRKERSHKVSGAAEWGVDLKREVGKGKSDYFVYTYEKFKCINKMYHFI